MKVTLPIQGEINKCQRLAEMILLTLLVTVVAGKVAIEPHAMHIVM